MTDINLGSWPNGIGKIRLGFNDKDYECGIHAPADVSSRHELIKNESELTPIHNNCSGKHAGMLALAKYLSKKGWYLDLISQNKARSLESKNNLSYEKITFNIYFVNFFLFFTE